MFKYEVAGTRCKTFDAALKVAAMNLKESDSVTCRVEFDGGETHLLTVERESNQVFFQARFTRTILNFMLQHIFDNQ